MSPIEMEATNTLSAKSNIEDAGRVSILMVDDEPSKLLSYEVILKDLGENLIKAMSGREALEQLLKSDVAVVLMDVSMPDMDGFELAEMICQHPRFCKTAIIFISGVYLKDVDRIKGYQMGAVDYVSVPVVPELLRAKVTVFTELHRKTRQLEILNQNLERRVAERLSEQKQAYEELRLRTEELMRFNRLAVGRELRMVELKKEINHLCQQLGQPRRYPLDFEKENLVTHV
jgi:response regulator RpfG family c-di-GMP phosphodiesterase